MKKYVISVDQGTSSTKCILVDGQGNIRHRINKKLAPVYRKGNYVEYDAEKIANDAVEGIRELRSMVSGGEAIAIALSVQTGAFVLWQRSTGKPVCNLISWQDTRGKEAIELMDAEMQKELEELGQSISDTAIPAKLYWMKRKLPEFEMLAEQKDLLFGTVDSWLVYRLTGGRVHACNSCNASISRLYDMEKETWKECLFTTLGLPLSMMPEVLDDNGSYGGHAVSEEEIIPISGVMGDSVAALFGQGCFTEGDVKVTYGTGASYLLNIGTKPETPPEGIVLNVAWRAGGKKVYAWEGTVYYAGAALNRVSRKYHIPLCFDGSVHDVSVMAETVKDSKDMYYIPPVCMFGKKGSEEGDGEIIGYEKGVEAGVLIRAALESAGYQIREIAEVLVQAGRNLPNYIIADGGGSRNEFQMQFQADILNIPVHCSRIEESSALGAAFMAGIGAGLWTDEKRMQEIVQIDRKIYMPQMGDEIREKKYAGWRSAFGLKK